ncbi:MAG: cation:proton antiporter [Actinomycetales bacterium]|nr:cation:proton antiporter [Actinomycetales bacterium]
MSAQLVSLLAICAVAGLVPLVVGLLRWRVAEAVLLIAGGVVLGPQVLGVITVDESIGLLSELGLGLLFFMAGLELDQRSVRGRSGALAATGWIASMAIALGLTGLLVASGVVQDWFGVALALTSTALGTLLPVLRDAGELRTPFGTLFMGAGAWGEFGPILAMALLLGSRSHFAAIASLLGFALIAAVVATLPRRLMNDEVRRLLEVGHHTSAQTALRLTMLMIVLLLTVSSGFGLDAVLGAFIAGIIVGRYLPDDGDATLMSKVEAIAFGFFIPLFFVVSGAKLDVRSIAANPLPMLAFFGLLLLARGLPQFLLYRKAIPGLRQRARFSLLVATGLPIIVAVTSLQVDEGVMRPTNAAALVGAGALSVLVFPLLGSALHRRPKRPAVDLPSASGDVRGVQGNTGGN